MEQKVCLSILNLKEIKIWVNIICFDSKWNAKELKIVFKTPPIPYMPEDWFPPLFLITVFKMNFKLCWPEVRHQLLNNSVCYIRNDFWPLWITTTRRAQSWICQWMSELIVHEEKQVFKSSLFFLILILIIFVFWCSDHSFFSFCSCFVFCVARTKLFPNHRRRSRKYENKYSRVEHAKF